MKTSFKILIPTILFIFIMIFTIFFNVKAEVKKYTSGEISTEKQQLKNFSSIIVNTKSSVHLYNSEKYAVLGDVNLSNYKITNDTLYITDTTNIQINFKSIKSITSTYGSNIIIDSIYTNQLNIYATNNSEININKGEIKNLKLISDCSSIYLRKCQLQNIGGKIKNNSFLSFYSKINSINIDSDTSSYFNASGWK